MGLNVGHGISVENLEVIRVTGRRIILGGKCGVRVNILVDDWPKLRTRLNRAARIAQKQQLRPDEQQVKAMQEMMRQPVHPSVQAMMDYETPTLKLLNNL